MHHLQDLTFRRKGRQKNRGGERLSLTHFMPVSDTHINMKCTHHTIMMSMLTLFLDISLFYFDKTVKEDVKPIASAGITRTLTVILYLIAIGVFAGLWMFYSDKSQWVSKSLTQSEYSRAGFKCIPLQGMDLHGLKGTMMTYDDCLNTVEPVNDTNVVKQDNDYVYKWTNGGVVSLDKLPPVSHTTWEKKGYVCSPAKLNEIYGITMSYDECLSSAQPPDTTNVEFRIHEGDLGRTTACAEYKPFPGNDNIWRTQVDGELGSDCAKMYFSWAQTYGKEHGWIKFPDDSAKPCDSTQPTYPACSSESPSTGQPCDSTHIDWPNCISTTPSPQSPTKQNETPNFVNYIQLNFDIDLTKGKWITRETDAEIYAKYLEMMQEMFKEGVVVSDDNEKCPSGVENLCLDFKDVKNGPFSCTKETDVPKLHGEAITFYKNNYAPDDLCAPLKENGPFQCTGSEPKSPLEILSLSVANTQLAFSVFGSLFVLILYKCKKAEKPDFLQEDELVAKLEKLEADNAAMKQAMDEDNAAIKKAIERLEAGEA